MVVASMTGGYFGAHFAQKTKPEHVGAIIIVIGFTLTVYFFAKPYQPLVAGFDNSTIFADGVVVPHGTEAQFHDQQGKCQKEGHGVRQNDRQ